MQDFCVNALKSVADAKKIGYTLFVNHYSHRKDRVKLMRKKDFITKRLTILITVVMAVLFVLQYGFYSRGSSIQLQKNATNQLSYLHRYVSEDISYFYTLSGEDATVFLATPPTINLPIAGYALLDNNRIVLAATSPFINGISLSEQVQQYTFSNTYSSEAFLTALSEGRSVLSRFYCAPLSGDIYAYSDVVAGTDLTLVIFHYASLIDSQISEATNLAHTFIISIIAIVVVLSAWLFFVHEYDRMILNNSRQLLSTERRRYKIARASTQNYIWEYSYADDSLMWDDTNSVSEIILDFSGNKRKEALHDNIVHPEDHQEFINFCNSIISPDPTVKVELRVRTGEKDYEWYRISGTKVFDEDGFPTSLIGQTVNIHERKLQFLALIEQAEQDQLTKLLSYPAFSKKASARITNMNEPVILAMLVIDIDAFDSLNQKFGFAFADAVLIDLASRLKKLCPENSLIGRYAADEFVILLDNIPSMAYVTDLAQQIMRIFAGFASSTKIDHDFSCCIGTALYPVDANTYEDLYNKAEIALYDAKSHGQGCYRIYDTSMSLIPEAEQKRKLSKRDSLTSAQFENRSVVDSTIIANAIDILFDSRDILGSINMMLSVIGVHYNLDRIFIREYSEDGETSMITHEWNANRKQSYAARGFTRSYTRTLLFRGYEQTESDMYHCDNISESADHVRLLNDIFLADVHSLVQFGIRFQNHYTGCINYCTTEKTHNWSSEELDSLALLSKLISSYLLHLHSQEKIDYVSQIDPLTNAYNLNAFLAKTDEIISENPDLHYAVLYSDVNQFKLFNDNYGYRAGDRILIALAEILKNTGGSNAIVARITGDKFVALYPCEEIDTLTELVKTIVYESKHIQSDTDDYYKLTLAIGIYPVQPGDSAIIAVDRANIARKNVADYHLCNYMYYDESMHNSMLEQKDIEDSMEDALQNHEFSVYYQPKFDITNGQLAGSEALVRWSRHAGMIPPIRFIPLFEENGFIVPLDYYVLDSVCASLRKRLDAGKKVLPVSVNFSRVHLSTDVLPVVIKSTLERYNIPPHLIEIEITESALASTEDYQIDILNEIHSLGCALSMDDFGSGMSSLNTLRKLPFDVLKIDRDFLYSNSSSERERIVLSNVVRMAFDLNMRVICEGVETKEQEEFLKQIGCRYVQGFLYARPLPEEQFISEYLDAE